MEIFTELKYDEMLEISKGSEATYNAGKEYGAQFRKALYNVGIIAIIELIVTREKVRL